jgi:hypothetical protein
VTCGAAKRCTTRALSALVLCLPTFAVQAALAPLVRQFVDNTANGKREIVCVYRLDGREFERRYPMGNFCPAYEEA